MEASNVPNTFWKYYDLYRRKIITVNQFAILSDLRLEEVLLYLRELGLLKKEKKGR